MRYVGSGQLDGQVSGSPGPAPGIPGGDRARARTGSAPVPGGGVEWFVRSDSLQSSHCGRAGGIEN